MPPRPNLGPPSPQPIIIYSGPATPTAYDPNWQYFTNLTPDQIAWFQAQPEWQNFLAAVALSPTTATAAMPVATVNAALQAAGKALATTPLPLPPTFQVIPNA